MPSLLFFHLAIFLLGGLFLLKYLFSDISIIYSIPLSYLCSATLSIGSFLLGRRLGRF
jgi:hypothetical protein